jgi:hypothetical protein
MKSTRRVFFCQWQVAIRIGNGQPAQLGQQDGLNYREAFLRAVGQILRCFFSVQTMEQFPGRVSEIEEWLAAFILKVTPIL